MIAAEQTEFYAAAERRIWRFQLGLGLLGIAGAWAAAGLGAAAGFSAGAGVSALNFLWLKQAVDAVSASATGAEPEGPVARRQRTVLLWKFLGRYVLLGAAGYVTLKYTSWNGRALLAGLFLFVAAILAEICFEIVTGLLEERHGRA
jgi:hypothetical protein